jgi:predicted negative regulator of RcsB-dependent stress response
MTTPSFPDTAPQPKAESFLDWFRINSRLVSIGAVVVIAAAFGVWFYNRSVALKNDNADKKLVAAKQSIGSGNIPLAQTDLKKVADQYAGTSAGAEAGMLLAQLKLDQGDYAGAVTSLKDLTSRISSGPYAASLRALLGDAYVQLQKPADAAAEYERASQLTSMPNERALLMAKVGRAYAAAGNHDKARRTWEALAVQQDNQALAAEARLRLGELLATGTKS